VEQSLRVKVNGQAVKREVPPRLTLADFLRDRLRLTGTHLGCEHGVCGACTVLLDGDAVRACLLLAVQADGREVTTVEGMGEPGRLTPLQRAFLEHGAFQCGFCTPGSLATGEALLRSGRRRRRAQLPDLLAGNPCRCTGYGPIVDAILAAAGSR